MTSTNDVRWAHEVLDGLFAGRILSKENEQLLRSFLPDLPKQKTLEELRREVYDVWAGTNGNEWPDDMYCDLENWLYKLHTQLKGLKDTHAAVPALPAGMQLADHEEYGRCVVSPGLNDFGLYLIFVLDSDYKEGAHWHCEHGRTLTFIDTEPAKSARPEFLETEADYQNAPEGTVVASSGRFPWVKGAAGEWACSSSNNSNFAMSKIGRRNVLRWGWGK